MARRTAVLVTLVAALLAGCTAAPTARLATSSVVPGAPAAPLAPVTAPLVRAIPGMKGPAPTVAVKAGAAPAELAVAAQTVAADVVTADAELEALELLAEDGGTYALQGWFQDLKDKIKRAWQR